MTPQELNKELGNIDIYLLDQLLKGRITPEMKILDAGCGEGRNLIYFMNNGHDIYGIDMNPSAIKMVRMLAKQYEPERFYVSTLEDMIFPPETFDYIICIALLHFAKNHDNFDEMMQSLLKVIKPGGTLFIRVATDVGLDLDISKEGTCILPDGSPRYVFKMKNLDDFLKKYGLTLIEHPRSTALHDLRSMSVFVLKKLPL